MGEDLPLKLCVLLTSLLQHVGVSGRAVCDSYSYVRRVRVRRLSCWGFFWKLLRVFAVDFFALQRPRQQEKREGEERKGGERGRREMESTASQESCEFPAFHSGC